MLKSFGREDTLPQSSVFIEVKLIRSIVVNNKKFILANKSYFFFVLFNCKTPHDIKKRSKIEIMMKLPGKFKFVNPPTKNTAHINMLFENIGNNKRHMLPSFGSLITINHMKAKKKMRKIPQKVFP